MEDRYTSEHDRAAGGMEYDDEFRERASDFGSRLAAEGPEALLEQIEELLPPSWREHIRTYPLAAVAIGVGIGLFLGMKKGDEIITAGSSLIAAAATANLNSVLSNLRKE
ncbi:MAG: hypothetical protein ACRD2J_04275 [Thermoanaerobaculia bacterium]